MIAKAKKKNKPSIKKKFQFFSNKFDLSTSKKKSILVENTAEKGVYIRLLNKPYENEVTLTGQNSPLKYC